MENGKSSYWIIAFVLVVGLTVGWYGSRLIFKDVIAVKTEYANTVAALLSARNGMLQNVVQERDALRQRLVQLTQPRIPPASVPSK